MTVGGDSSFTSGGIRIFIGPGPGVTSSPATYLATIKGNFSLSYTDPLTGPEVFTTINQRPSPVIGIVIP